MKLIFTTILILASFHSSIAQHYTFDSVSEPYEELVDYNSLAIEKQGTFTWNHRFELGFQFPFFELNYNHLNSDISAFGIFDNASSFSVLLMSSIYEWDNVSNPSNIESDIRYTSMVKQGIKCFVIQYTKMRLGTDISIPTHDSHINFQLWFFENGIMEIRFGSSNLANSSAYVPGEGFYLNTNDGPKLLGPNLSLQHPTNPNLFYDLSGDYNDLKENSTTESFLQTLPPENWVIRILPKTVHTEEVNQVQEFKIIPNPCIDYFMIDGINTPFDAHIYNNRGRLVKHLIDHPKKRIELRDLSPGMYQIFIKSDNVKLTQRIVKR